MLNITMHKILESMNQIAQIIKRPILINLHKFFMCIYKNVALLYLTD